MWPLVAFYMENKLIGLNGGASERALTELLRDGREFVDVLACVLAAGDTETKLKVEAL